MISYSEALNRIAALAPIATTETIPIDGACGRVLASKVFASMDHPPFTNSAMDGFAFNRDRLAADTLVVRGTRFAATGHRDETFDQRTDCIRIMTGAPLPEGTDTVIPVEQTRIESDGRVTFSAPPDRGSNVRFGGSDILRGTLLLKEGTYLTPEAILVATAFGYDTLPVTTLPRVGLFATGDELITPGSPLPAGGIYNNTRYFLAASFRRLGLNPDPITHLRDDPATAEAAIAAFAARRPGLIVTTGAVSAGDKDFIPDLAAKLGFTTIFHKVAVRPGKPLFLAVRGNDTVWLGIPGNPISTVTSWHYFVRPLLARWAGLPAPEKVLLTLANDQKKPNNLTCFFRAVAAIGEARIAADQGSGNLLASLSANAYIELPEATDRVTQGTPCLAIRI